MHFCQKNLTATPLHAQAAMDPGAESQHALVYIDAACSLHEMGARWVPHAYIPRYSCSGDITHMTLLLLHL